MYNYEEYCAVKRLNGETLNIVLDYYIHDSYTGMNKKLSGLYEYNFKDDLELEAFIKEHTEEAIKLAVDRDGNGDYLLNIQSMKDHPAMTDEGAKQFAERQMETYIPIIKYFLQYGFNDLFVTSSTKDIQER